MSTSVTFETTRIVRLPLSRFALGFPPEGDRGSAVLLLAHEMGSNARTAYQQAGYLHEGVCISSLDEQVFTLLESLQTPWCPWPDRGFTLAVWPHAQIGVLADRLIVQRHLASEVGAGVAQRQGGEVQ